MIGLGIWSFNTKKQLVAFEEALDNLKVDLCSNFMIPSKSKDIRKKIKTTKESLHLGVQQAIARIVLFLIRLKDMLVL